MMGHILETNPTFESMLGYTREELDDDPSAFVRVLASRQISTIPRCADGSLFRENAASKVGL
jgi:PAS domain S-box-containing protein